MVDPRFSTPKAPFRGWVFSLRAASCVLVLTGVSSGIGGGSIQAEGDSDKGQSKPVGSLTLDVSSERPSWSKWTGVPMEPIFAVDLFVDRRRVVEGTPEPELQASAPGGAAIPDEVAPTESAEKDPMEPGVDVGLKDQQPTPDTSPDAGTTPASSPKMAKGPWAALDLDLFRRAIAPVPAGIPVARATERRVERVAHIAEFGTELTGPNGDLWMRYLGDALRYGQSDPVEWASIAWLVAELELFPLAPAVVAGLELGKGSFVYQAAWSSLAKLYGQRFDSVEEWQSFVGDAEYNPLAKRVISELRERSNLARVQQLELLVYHLDRAAICLVDSDPLVRLGAADVLGKALRENTIDREITLDQLLEHLHVERQPDVINSMLEALFTVLENRPSGDLRVERLRKILAESALSQSPSAELLIARALARLPWAGKEAIAADSLETGVGYMAAILRRVGGVKSIVEVEVFEGADGGKKSEQDADVLVGILKALDKLCLGVGGDSVTSARLAANVDRSPLLSLVLSDEVDLIVREIAAGTLPRVAPPEDVAVLIEVLCSGDEDIASELRYPLMGAMQRFVERDDVSTEQIVPVVNCLLDHTGRPEEQLRERALKLLLSEALTAQITSEHAQLFIERLAAEAAPSLQDKLLLLIERYGDQSMLDSILGLPNFDSLVGRGAAAEKNMIDLVVKLAGSDPDARYSAAKRLYPRVDQTKRISLGERALALIAELPPESAANYSMVAHRDIVKWAFELRVYGTDLAKRMPNGVEFLQRLVDVHVPKSGGGEAYSAPEKALMQALFLSDVAKAKGNGQAAALRGEILAKFADAEEKAADHTAANFDKVIRRARARFFCGSGEIERAFKDFLFVFESDESFLLEPGDLRFSVQASIAQAKLRSAEAAASAGASAPLGEAIPSPADFLAAYRFGYALVTHPSWKKEPEPVRYDDLRGLLVHTQSSLDLAAIVQVDTLLSELPEQVSEEPHLGSVTGEDAPAPVWFELDRNVEQLAELNLLRAGFRMERSRLEAESAGETQVEISSEADTVELLNPDRLELPDSNKTPLEEPPSRVDRD